LPSVSGGPPAPGGPAHRHTPQGAGPRASGDGRAVQIQSQPAARAGRERPDQRRMEFDRRRDAREPVGVRPSPGRGPVWASQRSRRPAASPEASTTRQPATGAAFESWPNDREPRFRFDRRLPPSVAGRCGGRHRQTRPRSGPRRPYGRGVGSFGHISGCAGRNRPRRHGHCRERGPRGRVRRAFHPELRADRRVDQGRRPGEHQLFPEHLHAGADNPIHDRRRRAAGVGRRAGPRR